MLQLSLQADPQTLCRLWRGGGAGRRRAAGEQVSAQSPAIAIPCRSRSGCTALRASCSCKPRHNRRSRRWVARSQLEVEVKYRPRASSVPSPKVALIQTSDELVFVSGASANFPNAD